MIVKVTMKPAIDWTGYSICPITIHFLLTYLATNRLTLNTQSTTMAIHTPIAPRPNIFAIIRLKPIRNTNMEKIEIPMV